MAEGQLGKFGLGILLKRTDGVVQAEFRSANDGIPDEIIIMNLKVFLQNLEKSFFDKFSAVQK